jgi:hypothetical protein
MESNFSEVVCPGMFEMYEMYVILLFCYITIVWGAITCVNPTVNLSIKFINLCCYLVILANLYFIAMANYDFLMAKENFG